MWTSKQMLEALGREIARIPSLYWMVPIPPPPYRRQPDPHDEVQRP